jgi:hypothetical protein
MKHGQNMRRGGRPQGGDGRRFHGHGGHGGHRHHSFESSGPEVKIRGTAQQVLEKYLALARDAATQGDRIAAENYLQHAEHYYRIINYANANRQQQGNGGQRPPQGNSAQGGAPGANPGHPQASTQAGFENQPGSGFDQAGDDAEPRPVPGGGPQPG